MNDLDRFMASIRFVESGSWAGDYQRRTREPTGDYTVGAYGFQERNWPGLATAAGAKGANWRSETAQDYVAGQLMGRLHQQYGSWDLTAAAWIGGTRSANRILFRGVTSPEDITNEVIRDYVKHTAHNMARVPSNVPARAPKIKTLQGGWIFPVAGENRFNPRDFGIFAKNRTHQGVDIHATRGTPIVAPVSGTINFSKGGLTKSGEAVRLVGDDGIDYWFAHLDKRSVKTGQRIEAGFTIGTIGNSGNARTTGTHLHLEMKRNGERIDPAAYLQGGNSMPGVMPTSSVKPVQPQASQKAQFRLTGMFDAVSKAMAGGERTDYRKLEDSEPAPTPQVTPQPMVQPRPQSTPQVTAL